MKRAFDLLLVVVIFLFLPKESQAQFHSYSFEHLTFADGLSNNSINAILQTSDGFLWIATKDGLNRFDGQNFIVFKHDPNLSTSLPENYVMSLFESRDKTFWIGTWGGGLCRFDPLHEIFVRVKSPFNGDDYIQCINEDGNGFIWFGTLNGGLFKYDRSKSSFTNFTKSSESPLRLSNNNITSFIINKDNTLWLGSWGNGISFFDEAKNKVRSFTHKTEINSLAHNNVWFVEKEEGGKILVSTDYGVDRFDPLTNKFEHNLNLTGEVVASLNSPIRQTFHDSYGRLWIGSYEYRGLYLLKNSSGGKTVVERISKAEDDPQSLATNRIRWIYEDRKKNLWIGTEDGLDKLPATKPFLQFKFFSKREITLGGRVLSGIAEGNDSSLWVSFGGAGFDNIGLRTNKITHFKNIINNRNSLIENDISTMYVDRKGMVWLGTSHTGVDSYDPIRKEFKHYIIGMDNPLHVDLNWIQQIIETKKGELLIGTNAGLEILNRETGQLLPYALDIKGAGLLPKIFSVNALFEDSSGNLWIGTWLDGLFFYNRLTQRIKQFMPDPKNQNSLSANKVTCISEDSRGFIWVGTHSGGINKFDLKDEKFIRYTTKDGLPNDVVFGILEDKKGMLWISTLNGLAKFDPVKGKFRNYDVSDGIVNNHFNWHASYKSKSGVMYFGTVSGFISFIPDSVKIDPDPPSIAFTSFKVFGKEAALPQSLPATKEIFLNYDQNFFSIEFSALDIAPSHKHRFAYFLEGIDPSWVNAEKRSIAFYTDINPGKYKFSLRACNADGVWSAPLTLSIIIAPAWWMTWWFKTLIVVFILSLIYLIYLYRLKQMLAIQSIRLNIANDLHDEIGSNLSSISVDSQILLQSTKLEESEQELISFIGKTAKETVETMRDIIWFINPQNDFDTNLVIKMKETAAKLVADLEWTFVAKEDVEFDKFNLETRRNIFLIYKEALHNIVRHARATKCTITLGEKEKGVILTVSDNGIGFNVETVKENTGLRSIKRRALKIHGNLDIQSFAGNGTTLQLIVPYGK